jgi:uncharacterized membrane protein
MAAVGRELSETERYLRQVADGLEALGQTEAGEVLAELATHIAEATAEADGDESKALAGFGSPDLLATRILQERGLLAESAGLRDAPGWMRLAAVAIDAARWLFLLWFLLGPVFFIGVAGSPSPLTMALGWVYVLAVIAGTVWWWLRTRRRRGHVTAGMRTLGLRRVRVGDATRLVRMRDIPGLRRGRLELVGSVTWALLLVAMLAFGGYGLVSSARSSAESNRQQQIQQAVDDSTQAEALVRVLYDSILQGDANRSSIAPAAMPAIDELVARHQRGLFDSYWIYRVQLPDYKLLIPPVGRSREVVALVEVSELQKAGGDSASYQYTVVCRLTPAQTQGNSGSFSIDWQIEAAARTQ